ncbi:hypothetical protein R5R35_008525 [Gryllus longicercus]|uniref:Uncharacterized protein n=2 Tax=Gryllus longicercus TaxID=2509291 RepID=A0AAN9YXR4_9ORTH
MDSVVEAAELQFIMLTKQIQIEKEMCNNLNIQLTKIRESCTHTKEMNEVKSSFKTGLSIGVKRAEENIMSWHTSLDMISDLENELKKIMEQQNNERKRKQLMENLWNYERQWEGVKVMYKQIPTVNDVLELQKLTKQMDMPIMIKEQNVMETKLCISNYRKIKEKRKKSQIINLIKSSSKNKITSKQKFERKEKLRMLNISNNKVKTEKLSLMGNQHNVTPPNFVYRNPKIVDGVTKPPSYGILHKKFQATNLHGISPFPVGPISSITVPELMIPAFNATICRNASQATSTVHSSFPNGGDEIEQISSNAKDGLCIATPRKRKIDATLTSGLKAINHASTDKVIEASKITNISTDQISSTSLASKPSVSTIGDGSNLTPEFTKERSQNLNATSGSLRALKYLSQAMQQMTPRQESEASLNFGQRGVQAVFENEKSSSIPKALYNFDNKSKQTNVWDIFN